jgi:D-3-phosphoglycerate dehydrogenase
VAEHAIGFALSLARGYGALQQKLKAGAWAELRQSRPSFSGSRVGILGMGQIGHMIATRAQAFGAHIGYHTPNPKPDIAGPLSATYYADVISLAQNSDFLFAACPGGPSTYHLLNLATFEALGPKGYVINVARGSVLKTADLITALKQGVIAGAAVDVLEEEPVPPPALLAELAGLENLLITPHMSGRSPASVIAQCDAMVSNLEAGMAGKIPEYQVAAQRNPR